MMGMPKIKVKGGSKKPARTKTGALKTGGKTSGLKPKNTPIKKGC